MEKGNIVNGSDICGQIFYPHGTIILTRNNTQTIGEEINSNVGLLGWNNFGVFLIPNNL